MALEIVGSNPTPEIMDNIMLMEIEYIGWRYNEMYRTQEYIANGHKEIQRLIELGWNLEIFYVDLTIDADAYWVALLNNVDSNKNNCCGIHNDRDEAILRLIDDINKCKSSFGITY